MHAEIFERAGLLRGPHRWGDIKNDGHQRGYGLSEDQTARSAPFSSSPSLRTFFQIRSQESCFKMQIAANVKKLLRVVAIRAITNVISPHPRKCNNAKVETLRRNQCPLCIKKAIVGKTAPKRTDPAINKNRWSFDHFGKESAAGTTK